MSSCPFLGAACRSRRQLAQRRPSRRRPPTGPNRLAGDDAVSAGKLRVVAANRRNSKNFAPGRPTTPGDPDNFGPVVAIMPIWSPGVLDNVEHPLVGPLRDGLPTVLAIVGSDANGRRAAVVQFERPDMYRRRGKQSKEELHLERFILDSKAQDGAALFDTFRSGSDPPDLVATRNGKELGVDLTQLVLQDRAAANAAFRAIRKEAVTRGVRRFRNLRRQLVYIVFGPETGGLPP